MTILEVVEMALTLDGVDLSFCPEDWLTDYLETLAQRRGRTVSRSIIQEAIHEAIHAQQRAFAESAA